MILTENNPHAHTIQGIVSPDNFWSYLQMALHFTKTNLENFMPTVVP